MKGTNGIMESIKRALLCCTRPHPERRSLKISSPTDVRRVDICITGLSEEHQAFIRSKAADDATRMFGTNASTPLTSTSTTTLTCRDDTHTHTAPRPRSHTQAPRIKSLFGNHARKLSASLPYGYKSVHKNSDSANGSMVALRDRQTEGGFEKQGTVGGRMSRESDRQNKVDNQGIVGGGTSRESVDGSGSDGESSAMGLSKEEEISLVMPTKV